jgi:hypothetical protein
MNPRTKQLVASRFENLVDSCLDTVENKALIKENFERMLREVLEAKDRESLESVREKYAAMISSKQFISINFDFRNIILGRAKPYYTSVPFDNELRNFYYPLSTFKDLISADNLFEIDIRNGSKLFQKNCIGYQDFLTREAIFNVSEVFTAVHDNKVVVQIESSKHTIFENLFCLLFISFVCANVKFQKNIKDFLMDLLSIESFLIRIRRISLQDMSFLNSLIKAIIESCDYSKNFLEDVIDNLNHIASNEFVVQELTVLLTEVLVMILQNTNMNFYKMILTTRAPPELIPTLKSNLNLYKSELLQLLSHQNTAEVNFRHLLSIYNMFNFIFNIQNSDLMVFDSSFNVKLRGSQAAPSGTVIIFNENTSRAPYMLFNEEVSFVLQKFYMRFSYQDFDDANADDNVTEGSIIRVLRYQKFERVFFQQHE